MGSVSSAYKCPKCGSENAQEEYWYHTGEYSRFCPDCKWSQSHMLDHNSKRILYTKNMPIDKSILDITLPDLSDILLYHKYRWMIGKMPSSFSFGPFAFDSEPEPMSYEDMPKPDVDSMRESDKDDLYVLGAAACLIEPFRKYIADAISREPEIKAYAQMYSEKVPFILYDIVSRFVDSRLLTGYDNKKERLEQYVYELYVVLIKIFDKYKYTNADELNAYRDSVKETVAQISLIGTGGAWRLFKVPGYEECMAQMFLDIAEILSDYRKNNGYITFAFWYSNDRYYSPFCGYSMCSTDYHFLEGMNTASNDMDYAAGRFDEYGSSKFSLYTTGAAKILISRHRSSICYVRVSGDEHNDADKEKIARMKEFMASVGYRYYNIITDSTPVSDCRSKSFRKLLKAISRRDVSKIIVLSRDELISEGFDMLDYFCYLSEIDLIVLDDPDREKPEDDDLYDYMLPGSPFANCV